MTVSRAILALLALFALALSPARAQAPHIAAKLVAESPKPAPGGATAIALSMTPEKGWHGYWLNGGDAGFGLSVGYHNHAQEFIATFGGVSAYERFVELTDPRVQLELDLFWALTGGQDVPALVARLGDRLTAVHVKDGIVPAVNPWAPEAAALGGSGELDQRRPGDGDVALADALRAGTAIRYAVVEYDNAPGDVFADVAASLAFLKDGGFVA